MATKDIKSISSVFSIGAYDRPELKEYGAFDEGDDFRELVSRATTLAFSHACTGPTEEDQNAGAHYQVRDEAGRVVFSIEVTKEGNDLLSQFCKAVLSGRPELMRQWVDDETLYAGYCRSSGVLLNGDVYNVVENIIVPKLEAKSYRFDGDPQLWKDFLSVPKSKPIEKPKLEKRAISLK